MFLSEIHRPMASADASAEASANRWIGRPLLDGVYEIRIKMRQFWQCSNTVSQFWYVMVSQ